MDNRHPHQFKKNLIHSEIKVMREVYTNPDIIIKPADNGGSIVVMNTEDYI